MNNSSAIQFFEENLRSCALCPRKCGINRDNNETGFCGMDNTPVIHSYFAHNGEEPPLIAGGGSGTIFFSGCPLKCLYCQNFKFSHVPSGKKFSSQDLAGVMLELQDKQVSNINLVTPTHFLPSIIKAIIHARKNGLNLPVVYNSSGYERPEVIRQLSGFVDIYLPDMKYFTEKSSWSGSKIRDYCSCNQASILEMFSQVKTPVWGENGLKKGIIIRHLVLPNYISESKQIISWVEKNAPGAYMSIMAQYRPYYMAKNIPGLDRSITFEEYSEVRDFLENSSLSGWIQEFDPPQDLAGINF